MRTRRAPATGITSRGHCWTGRRKHEGQRIPAVALESLVVRRIRDWLADRGDPSRSFSSHTSDAVAQKRLIGCARAIRGEMTGPQGRGRSHIHALDRDASRSTWTALISRWIRIGSVGALVERTAKPSRSRNPVRSRRPRRNAVHSCSSQAHRQGDADHRRRWVRARNSRHRPCAPSRPRQRDPGSASRGSRA